MILKGKDKRTLVILGAGATRGALRATKAHRVGAPLNGDFFNILENYIKTDDGRKYSRSFHRLLRFIRQEVGLKGIGNPNDGKPGNQYPTMEAAFNVLFLSKDLPMVFHKGRGRRRAKGFRPEVVDFLTLLLSIFRYVQQNSKPRDNIEHHQRLVGTLRPNDVVMTLNYDTLLDNALFRAGWNPRKGYGFNVNNINTRPKVICPELRNVVLLKPHGSFNWFAKGSFGTLTSMLERRKVSEVIISEIPRVSSIRRRRLVQMFIPPLYAKFFGNDFWCSLWTKTYEAARDVERLVIVGCSLIATDFHLRAILAKALNDRRRKYREIIVVDPSEDTQKKLKAFFRGRSEVGIKIYKDFSTFCRAECK